MSLPKNKKAIGSLYFFEKAIGSLRWSSCSSHTRVATSSDSLQPLLVPGHVAGPARGSLQQIPCPCRAQASCSREPLEKRPPLSAFGPPWPGIRAAAFLGATWSLREALSRPQTPWSSSMGSAPMPITGNLLAGNRRGAEGSRNSGGRASGTVEAGLHVRGRRRSDVA